MTQPIQNGKSIAIIGGGIAGLSAGIYALRSGFKVDIYEQHLIAGGECTAWERKGYHIDNCVHWLTGTNPKTEMYQVWKELNVLGEDVEIIQNPSFLQLENEGLCINMWEDTEKIRQELLAISPEDAAPINDFVDTINVYKNMDMPALKPMEQYNIWELFKLIKKLMPLGKVHGKLSILSLEDYANRFKNKALRDMIMAYMPYTYNVSSWFFVLGTFCNGNGALPKGGSAGMIERMVALYTSLGGQLHTRKKAVEFHYKGKRVSLVEFADGSTATADYIVCACDASVTFKQLLKDQFPDKFFIQRLRDNKRYPIYSSLNTYIAVDHADCSFIPDTTWFKCEPYTVLGKEKDSVLIKNYSSEPSFYPEGKNLFQTLLVQHEDDYNKWEDLYLHDREAYKAEKKHAVEAIMERIETHYPILKGKLTAVEVVSPYSFHRYCGAYKGAYMSFILTPFAKKKSHKGKVRGLKNVFLSGQWLQPPGGLPNAAVTGRFVIQRICKVAGIPFKAE